MTLECGGSVYTLYSRCAPWSAVVGKLYTHHIAANKVGRIGTLVGVEAGVVDNALL